MTFRASLPRQWRQRAEAELARVRAERQPADVLHAVAGVRTLEAMGFPEERAVALCSLIYEEPGAPPALSPSHGPETGG